MIKDYLSYTALVVGLALSLISLKQWFSAPSIDLSASVESSIYKSHPTIQDYIDGELKDTSEIEINLQKLEEVKNQNFTKSQLALFASSLREQAYNIKHIFNYDARTFLVYKIDNSGNKAASNVALVNSLGGVALIEGTTKSVRVSDKEPVELGEIPPRSSKLVYFWTSDYYYPRGDHSIIKYSDGTVDIDATVPLGGIYKHFHDYGIIYQFMIFSLIILLALIFGAIKFPGKASTVPAEAEPAKPKRRRRPRRRKSQSVTQTLD